MSEEDRLNCKIVFLGTSAPGKTCIIGRFVYNEFSYNFMATPGASFVSKTIFMKDENQYIKFEIWDTSSGLKYLPLAKILYKNAEVIILVYSITDRRSFDDLKYYVKDIKENGKSDASK